MKGTLPYSAAEVIRLETFPLKMPFSQPCNSADLPSQSSGGVQPRASPQAIDLALRGCVPSQVEQVGNEKEVSTSLWMVRGLTIIKPWKSWAVGVLVS